jgi:NADPH:quinone reductase-like Zn-dependent oxidoreductase
MRSVQVAKPNGPFEIVEQDIPEPGAGKVRIKVLDALVHGLLVNCVL